VAIEVCLICDRCLSIIAGDDTRKKVRAAAKNRYQRINGEDVCAYCVALAHNRRPEKEQ